MKSFFVFGLSIALCAVLAGCNKSDNVKVEESNKVTQRDTASTNPVKSSKKAQAKGPITVVDPSTAAIISGKIKFIGTPPKRKKISVKGNSYCFTKHASGFIWSEAIVINENKTLRNVLVYVKKGLEGKNFSVLKEHALINQNGCWFTPHVIAVMMNQPVKFRNSDATMHNVYIRSKRNKAFNFTQPVQGMETTKYFKTDELGIRLKCATHSWMSGYMGVFSHPYFAVTGEDGSFILKNLPPGEYEVEAWHEKYGVTSKTIKVGKKETKSIDFTFEPGTI